MSNKMRERLLGKTADLSSKVAAAPRTSISEQGPTTMPGQLGAFRLEAQKYKSTITELTAELEAARAAGGTFEVELDMLHEVPGRRRFMPKEKFEELRENLRSNELVHPVVVMPRQGNGFDIVSGHHRVDAFRALGRARIRATLYASDAGHADRDAFYANLLQSDLTDFEKFSRFSEYLSANPTLTQAKVAQDAGLSPASLSALMSFEALPPEVLGVLREDPSLLGATAGYALATLARAGKGARVVEAVNRLRNGEFDQARAVKFASATDEAVKAPPQATGFKIKRGRATYCDMRVAKNVVRLQFQTEEEAQAIQSVLRDVLEAQSGSGKA